MADYGDRAKVPAFYTYAESVPLLMILSDADAGKYYKAKCQYFFNDVDMTFEDYENPDMLIAFWTFEKPKLDANKKAYYLTTLNGMFAAYCRDRKKEEGENELTRDGWYIWAKAVYRDDVILNNAFECVSITDFVNTKSKVK
ncbi:MAG: hypothetical protein IKG57_06280 [Enterococcus sp.]|uniref:hypothetical protein n=1 Tax=Enterococcus sp. TaxID=35783 RepID=UPI00257C09F2|nr:hypothetical protein [Enterococcus sp.]MBR2525362.1 hypothetical protein [bacterium]MBR3047767.1 hypothetical protein [Enterococcus sp.]